jgi:carbon starvation protein CstA
VQIQNYSGENKDRNPYNHSAQDGYEYINQTYLFNHTKASVAFAGHLLGPIALEYKIRLPLMWAYKY